MIVRTNNPSPAPCGISGLGCSGNCGSCPGRAGLAGLAGRPGMGALWDSFPAPFNNPLVLAAIAVAVLMILGGGLKFLGLSKSSGKRRAKLRLIQAQAAEQRAKLLAA